MTDAPDLTLKLLAAEQANMREDIAGLWDDLQKIRAEQHALASLLGLDKLVAATAERRHARETEPCAGLMRAV
jgi:hypothetical protein